MANEHPPRTEGGAAETAPVAALPSPESLEPVTTPPLSEGDAKRIQELLPQQGEAGEAPAAPEQQEQAQESTAEAAQPGTAAAHATPKGHDHHGGGHGHHGFTATVGASGWFFMLFGLIGSALSNLTAKVFKAIGLKTEGGGGGGGGGGGHDDHH